MVLVYAAVTRRVPTAGARGWAKTAVHSMLIFEALKTILFVYVVVRQSVKAYRHLRARGVFNTLADGYRSLLQVCIVCLFAVKH